MQLASPAYRQRTFLSQAGIINFRYSLPSSHTLTLELMEVFLVKQSMLSLMDHHIRSNH